MPSEARQVAVNIDWKHVSFWRRHHLTQAERPSEQHTGEDGETTRLDRSDQTAIYSGLLQALPALQYRDFRLFWFGQMISLAGTWIQTVAQQWLVLKLTGSAFKLGLVTTVQFSPLLLLALVGGSIADRLPKRNLLLATQVISAVLAVLLGVLVQSGAVQYWHVLVLAAALGTVNAFYTPARQAFVPELVDKKVLISAVALNSAIFNGARVIGPAIGGVLVAALGLSLNFYIN
ncbi:MAG TPA: MFS transporter, partial [Chloroflexota bacterium]